MQANGPEKVKMIFQDWVEDQEGSYQPACPNMSNLRELVAGSGEVTPNATVKNVFRINYFGTEELSGDPSIKAMTTGSFQLILDNKEVKEDTRNYGKVKGLGNVDIRVTESGCKYKFQGTYRIYEDNANLYHDSEGWWIDFLNQAEFLDNMDPPSDIYVVYPTLDKKTKQGPDCYQKPIFNIGRDPLLDTCKIGLISLSTRLGSGTEGTLNDQLKCTFKTFKVSK